MSELSCDTPFIGQIETHDLVRNPSQKLLESTNQNPTSSPAVHLHLSLAFTLPPTHPPHAIITRSPASA